MMDGMLPGGLLGFGLIVRDRHERLLAEARGDRLVRVARGDRAPSRLRAWVRRVAATCPATSISTSTSEGTDR